MTVTGSQEGWQLQPPYQCDSECYELKKKMEYPTEPTKHPAATQADVTVYGMKLMKNPRRKQSIEKRTGSTQWSNSADSSWGTALYHRTESEQNVKMRTT